MAIMEGRVFTADRVTMDAAGVIAAAGADVTGRLAKEGNRPPFYFSG
jgi:hypothetical protein